MLSGERSGLRYSASSNMPRSRERLQLKRQAAAHHQQQADRAFQRSVLEREAEEPTPTSDTSEEEIDPWGPRWRANNRIAALMREAYGPTWPDSQRLQRLAQSALLDAVGQGSGRSLDALIRKRHHGGTYQLANDFRFLD